MTVQGAWFDVSEPERLSGNRNEIVGEIVLDIEGGIELAVDARGIVNKKLGRTLPWDRIVELIEHEGIEQGALPVDA